MKWVFRAGERGSGVEGEAKGIERIVPSSEIQSHVEEIRPGVEHPRLAGGGEAVPERGESLTVALSRATCDAGLRCPHRRMRSSST